MCNKGITPQICDAVPPIHVVSYHVATDKTPPKMVTSSGLFLATIYNQSQLVERKHVARYWLISTAATAVPLSTHPSPLVITTKLAVAILGGGLFGGGVLPAQYCPCGSHSFTHHPHMNHTCLYSPTTVVIPCTITSLHVQQL